MQAPDRGDRNDQDYDIGGDIDDTRTDQNGVVIHTLSTLGHQIGLAETFERDGQDEGNGVEQVSPEGKPDGPPDTGPARTVWDEDALIEQHNGGFCEEHAHSHNDLDVAVNLIWGRKISLQQAAKAVISKHLPL